MDASSTNGSVEKLYLTIAEAAEWSGVGEKKLRSYVNSIDPPPMLRIGKKVLIQRSKLPLYLESKQDVIWVGR